MLSLVRTLALLLLFSGLAHALPDQSICYQVKDSLKLKGTLDPDASTIPLQPGCNLSKTRYLCVPAVATASNVVDRKTGPISPTFYAPSRDTRLRRRRGDLRVHALNVAAERQPLATRLLAPATVC